MGIGMMEFCRAAVRERACLLRPSLSLSFDFDFSFSGLAELSLSFDNDPRRVRPAELPLPLGLTTLSSPVPFADDEVDDTDSVSSLFVDLRRPASSDMESADGNDSQINFFQTGPNEKMFSVIRPFLGKFLPKSAKKSWHDFSMLQFSRFSFHSAPTKASLALTMSRLLLTVALVAVIALAGVSQTSAFGWEKVDAILSNGILDHTTPGLQALVADANVCILLSLW